MKTKGDSIRWGRGRGQWGQVLRGWAWLIVVVTPLLWAGDRRGAVATVHPLATRAGLEAMTAGGNAIDAAVACALTLGVVDGHNSGLGGGCFLLVRLADGRTVAVDGREMAPAAATREMFLLHGKADPHLSQDGVQAVGVPGELAALAYVSTNFGRLPLRRGLESAARIAERGFAPDAHYRGRLKGTVAELDEWVPGGAPEYAEFRRLWGQAPEQGKWVFRQPELAATYRRFARGGVAEFYAGDWARQAVAELRRHGGLHTAEDFAGYRPVLREPLRTTYRGVEILGFPPPSSGGVHVGEILNVLEHFDLRAMGEDSPDLVHVVAEAMKLAFADRAHWLGDPDFTRVPRGLMAKEYAVQLAARIDRRHAGLVPGPGIPPGVGEDWFGREAQRHTTHFSTADADGNWVACTATINTTFGSKVVVPGTGLVLNNQMDDFAAQPGVPNAFGLVGADANAVAARKRPLSSMSPTVVLRSGRPILSVGAAGGPTIISQTLLAIIRVVDFQRSPAEALRAPRFHHQWKPDVLKLERGWPETVATELRQRGHRVEWVDALGATQAVGARSGGGFEAAADPRVPGLGATR
jgi:gamma-glutamyltranspeptidase/glutathione hydrolase